MCDDLTPYTSSPRSAAGLHFAQVVCRRCALVISQPQALASEIAHYYRDVYYGTHWPDAERQTRDNTEVYAHYELPFLQDLWADWAPPAGAQVVEIGCGYGAMLPLLAGVGYRVMGCDPSSDAVRFCRTRDLDVVQGTLPGVTLPGPFDLTLCQHVIEHVTDPRAFVGALASITRPGGLVAIVTEDAWNTQWAWERWCSRIAGRLPRFHTSTDHTYVFQAPHLTQLLKDAGCDRVRTRSFSYRPDRESLHWRAYKGTCRMLDRLLSRGDFLMAVGRLAGS